ncbi:MAG: RagB/SusD family nutrient uptake outer membrane protein [Leadbetterella sp.]
MKSLKKVLIFIIILSVSFSCDDFLKDAAKPIDQLGGENFFNSEGKIRAGLTGIYSELYSYRDATQHMKFYENRSDNGGEVNADNDPVSNFSLDRNGSTGDIWFSNFRIISRCNVLLEDIEKNLPNASKDPKLNRYIGEARFLRGFAYFNLVSIYGDVPLVLKQAYSRDEAVSIARSPIETVFNQAIIPDLEYASKACFSRKDLVAISQLGNVTQGAAKTLLAEAYLNVKKFVEAEKVSEEVIDSKDFTLLPNYTNLYGVGANNNTESMWEIQFNFAQNAIPNIWIRLLPFELADGSTYTQPQVISTPSQDLADAMKGDPRSDVTFGPGLQSLKTPTRFITFRFWKKYHDFSIVGPVVQNEWNIKMLRLADAYHMAAEAEIQQGKINEGFAHLNTLRKRVGLTDYTQESITSTSDALDLYLHERRMEFAGEMKRFRDLKRTGRAIRYLQAYRSKVDKLNVIIPETKLVFPIPNSEIQANPNLTQNPGY